MYKFDRILHYDDITLIKMKINGEEKTFYLKWDNPYQTENPKYQSSLISTCGHLYLKVADFDLNEFLEDYEVNDEEAVHQHFIMLGMEDGFDA